MTAALTTQTVLDALGHGVLVFASDGKLLHHNVMAGTILGKDLKLIKDEGWRSAAQLFEADLQQEGRTIEPLDEVRKRALQSERPIRFHIYRSGEYVPCWASAVPSEGGEVCTMLTIDVPDWEVVGTVLDKFRSEMKEAVDSTRGHVELITRTLKSDKDDEATAKLGRRIGGFTRLIAIHMSRSARFMRMLERLEDIRTGKLRERIKTERKKISVEDYLEEFLEALDEVELLDPETDVKDYRSRIQHTITGKLYLNAARRYVTYTLQELLRNAIMYSLRAAPIKIKATEQVRGVQFDVTDEGYGIRAKDIDQVFKPFARAKQPQVISEFGYGLSLYLCKYEIEAMGGTIWQTSEENVGTTFSFVLPAWRDETPPTSSSSTPTT
jgi:PAS domain-containing protein